MNELNLDDEFCCTCLKVSTNNDKFLSINSTALEDTSYKNKLKCCVPEMSLEEDNDCFLCKPCLIALETAYTFRCMCLRTKSKLEEFRITQRTASAIAKKAIKQELIDLVSAAEETSEQFIEDEDYVREVTEVEDPLSIVEPTYSEAISVESAEISTKVFEGDCTPGDSKIDIVKSELGALLTENIGNTIDINIRIFNENAQRAAEFSSEINLVDSLDGEIGELKKHAYYKPNETKAKVKKVTIAKETKFNISKSKQSQKIGLSDLEIVSICCKTIPELQNCPPEALECQVSLEKLTNLPATVNELPIKRNKVKKIKRVTYFKDKAFWCSVCKKDVKRKDRFNAHILRHSDIRAYKCKSCPSKFFSSDTLGKHKKNCPGVNGSAASISNAASDISNSSNIEEVLTEDSLMIKKEVKSSVNNKKLVKKIEKPSFKIKAIAKTDPIIRRSVRKQIPSTRLCNMTDTVYRCKQCKYQSYYKQKYQLHLLHHNEDRQFSCSDCPKKFFDKWELSRHISSKHTNTDYDNSLLVPVNEIYNTPQISNEPPVKIVKRQVPTNNFDSDDMDWDDNSLLRMIEPAISLTVHPGPVVVTPVIQSIHSLASSSVQGDTIEMSFACKLCNISFKSRNLLMLHTQTHELKHTCSLCSQQFICETDFLNHMQTHQVIETTEPVYIETPPKLPKKKKKKKFFCTVCNMEFSCRDHANVHTGAKPYACKVCLKQFAAYSTLRKHKLTHGNIADSSSPTGQKKVAPQRKLHACNVCKKQFVNKEHVYSHSCHTAAGDSVYRCQICKNPFVGRTALIEHMGVHINQNAIE